MALFHVFIIIFSVVGVIFLLIKTLNEVPAGGESLNDISCATMDFIPNIKRPDLAYLQAGGWFAWGILFFFSDQLDRSYNLWFLLVLILGLPLLLLLAIAIISLGIAIFKQRWWQCLSILLAPAFSLLVLLPDRLGYDADWIKFQFTKSVYLAVVKNQPESSLTWNWGRTGGANAVQIDHFLVYGETNRTLQREQLYADHTTVRSMGDHFYLVTIVY